MNYIAYIWLYYGYSSAYIIPTRFIIVFVYNRLDLFFFISTLFVGFALLFLI